MIQTFALTMNVARHPPLEHHPQIEQEEGHADEQQPQSRIGGRGARPHPLHLAITGLDSKPVPIKLKDLQRMRSHPVGHIGKPLRELEKIKYPEPGWLVKFLQTTFSARVNA